MTTDQEHLVDEIGPWSEIKLEIIRKYATAYSTILSKQPSLHHVYIDAFAGLGYHKSKTTKLLVPGSPRLAVETEPPFEKYYFIDMDQTKVDALGELDQGTARKEPLQAAAQGDLLQLGLDRLQREDQPDLEKARKQRGADDQQHRQGQDQCI